MILTIKMVIFLLRMSEQEKNFLLWRRESVLNTCAMKHVLQKLIK